MVIARGLILAGVSGPVSPGTIRCPTITPALPGLRSSVLYGTRSLVMSDDSGGVRTTPVCESPEPCPWPGKCL